MGYEVIESTVLSKQYLVPRLEAVCAGTGNRFEKELNKECVVIGRADSSDIVVDDNKLSRNHFMIFNRDGKYQVKDLDSTNGIVVNGKKTSHAILTGSDEIRAGHTTFKFMLTNNNYKKPEQNKGVAPSQFINFSFDSVYSRDFGEKAFYKSIVIKSMIIGLLVTGVTASFLINEQEAKVAPVVVKTAEKPSLTVLDEIRLAKLSADDSQKAFSIYKLAEYHFNVKNYDLARKSMQEFLSIVPNSNIATAFIASCEEILSKTKVADDKLDEIMDAKRKRELVAGLINSAFAEMSNNNYEEAIKIFQRVIELDPYNSSAFAGITEAEKAMQEKLPMPPETIEVAAPNMGEAYAKQMQIAFNNNNYTKAYELANRIVRMGQSTAGRPYFVAAMRTQNKITDITDKKYANRLYQAKTLTEADGHKQAQAIYTDILSEFPYQRQAKSGIVKIFAYYHIQAKNIYAKGAYEESLNNIREAKANWKMILDIVPENDDYYRKATDKLRHYKAV